MDVTTIKPGTRIRIERPMRCRDRVWTAEATGAIESILREPTGSWCAQGRHGRLWLWRVDLRKDDGELTKLALDAQSTITILD